MKHFSAIFLTPKLIKILFTSLVFIFIWSFNSCSNTAEPNGDPNDPNNPDTNIVSGTLPDTLNFADSLNSLSFVTPNGNYTWNTFILPTYVTISPGVGSGGDSVTITIDRMATGWNTGLNDHQLSFISSDTSIGTAHIILTIQILAAGTPKLNIPAGFNLNFKPGDTLRWINLLNSGGGKLDWSVKNSSTWLTISPDSGSFDGTAYLTMNWTGLGPGTYRDTLRINTNGGDTLLPVEAIIFNSIPKSHFSEYWPLSVGNQWAWLSPDENSWWALAVVDSFFLNGFPIYKLRADDSYGGTGQFWATYVNNKFTLLGDSTRIFSLPSITYSDCTFLDCWSGGYTFALFEDSVEAGHVSDPYWKTNSEYIPDSLSNLLDRYFVYQKGKLSSTDLVTGDVPDALGLRETRAGAADTLYTIFAKGLGPVVWDGYTLIQIKAGSYVAGSVPDSLQALHFAVNEDTTSELLYWFVDDNLNRIYYKGYRDSTMPVPTQIIFEDDVGNPAGTIFLRSDFIPTMWILNDFTIGVHNLTPDTTGGLDSSWDPTTAYHISLTDSQFDFSANLLPQNPIDVIDSLEWFFNDWYTEIRTFLEDKNIQSWNDLVAAAWIPGSLQPKFQALATFISMGTALMAYEKIPELNGFLFKRTTSKNPTLGMSSRDLGMAKDMMVKIATFLKEEAECKYCPKPGVPTVQMLQCQGLKAIVATGQICHNSFMMTQSATKCLNLCTVSTQCFTNICMPRQVALSDVEKVLFENNLELTASEARDAVKQNISNLKNLWGD